MFWNMIGLNLMNSIGFRCTSILFMFFNSLIFLATYNIGYDNYDPQTCKYSFVKIIALFFNWVAMVFCFGGSSLLAQQKFIDYYSLFDYKISEEELETSYKQLLTEMVTINKPNDINNNNIKADGTNNNTTNNIDNNDINKKKEEQKEKDIKEELEKKSEDKRKKNFDSLPFFGLAVVIAYSGKYGIGYRFHYYIQNNIINESLYNNTNDTDINNTNYFYSNNETNTSITNNSDINYNNYELYQNVFFYISLIYIGCIIIGVLFYTVLINIFFAKKINNKEQKYKNDGDMCKILGFVLYCENLIVDINPANKLINENDLNNKDNLSKKKKLN